MVRKHETRPQMPLTCCLPIQYGLRPYPVHETGTVSHGNVSNRNIATPTFGKLNVIQLSKAS